MRVTLIQGSGGAAGGPGGAKIAAAGGPAAVASAPGQTPVYKPLRPPFQQAATGMNDFPKLNGLLSAN